MNEGHNSRRRSAYALCVMFFLCLLGLDAHAQQTVTVSIPQRGFGNPKPPEIASIRLSFQTSGVGGSPSIGVDGTAVALPGSTCDVSPAACVSVGAGGGHAVAIRFVNPSRVDMTVILTADFVGNNLCGDLSTPATRTVTLALTNVNATTYRMASYSVPSRATPANPAPKCDVPFRRVDTSKATAATAITFNGRLPLDVVLVLDKSGSMGGFFPHTSSGDTRWKRLGVSVNQFLGLWETASSPGVEGSPDDRLGLVFFDSTAHAVPLDGTKLFKSRGTAASPWSAISSAVGAAGPSGSTTIGGALVSAVKSLDTVSNSMAGSPPPEPNDATIVLFTDGEQNTSPSLKYTSTATAHQPLLFDCTGQAATCVRASGQSLNTLALVNLSTPVLTIGLGDNTGPFATLLDDVSNQTAGRAEIPNNAVAMDTNFGDNLVEALKGNTLSLNSRETGTLAPADAASPQLVSSVDGSVKRIIFVMGWSGGNGESVELAVTDPTGANRDPTVRKAGAFYRVFAYDITDPGQIGDWNARVARSGGGAGPNAPSVDYHVSAYAVEGRLSYRFADSSRLGTGLPVTIHAEVGWDGKPLDALPSGSLRVTIERPGENFGNILHDSTAKGTPVNSGGDQQDSLGAKLDSLTNTANLLERTAPKPLPTSVELADKGHGIYEGTFSDTTVGGQYRLRLDLSWTDPRTEKIRRTEVLERQLPVVPSVADSIVQSSVGAGTTTLQVIPRDHLGNYVGPGYASQFGVQVTGGGSATLPLTDSDDRGIYTLGLTGIPPGSDPQIKITFRGETVRDTVLSKIADGGSAGNSHAIPWWLWLLILLVLIVLFIVLRKKGP